MLLNNQRKTQKDTLKQVNMIMYNNKFHRRQQKQL